MADAYNVQIVPRSFGGQANDDWHATVTRHSDGKTLLFTAPFLWVLRWRVRPRRLAREFKSIDRYEAKMARSISYTVPGDG